MSPKTDLTALVTLLGGNPVEVMISTDPETLKRLRRAFVKEQGNNADYQLCEVEILASERMADLASIQGLLSTSQEMQVVPLWCKHCDWWGPSSEAGWSDGTQGFEWTCPECGGAEWIRVATPETAGPAQM
ncbi:MAG: hypothetical protein SXV54_20165 [Chloroflexota bacterium]|nr:hypothetical protein [Chloroflexota bacterium]